MKNNLTSIIKKNKKANVIPIIMFFIILFVILFLGFIMIVGSSILNWVFDETIPELQNLGVIGSTNMTDVASYTLTPINNIVQSLTFITGVIYVMMLIASVGFAFMSTSSPSKWLIGFYFGLVLLLILTSMFISNMYEDFYNGTDDFAVRLKEHTLLSYMIIYSPVILTVIVFLTGIILFSGLRGEEYI